MTITGPRVSLISELPPKMLHLMYLCISPKLFVCEDKDMFSCFVFPQLIDYAKKGDTDEKAMKMASFWLTVRFFSSSSRQLCTVSRCVPLNIKQSVKRVLSEVFFLSAGKGSNPKALQGPCSTL